MNWQKLVLPKIRSIPNDTCDINESIFLIVRIYNLFKLRKRTNNQYSCFFVFTKVLKTSIYSPKLFNIIIYVESIPALFILQKNKRIHLDQISIH